MPDKSDKPVVLSVEGNRELQSRLTSLLREKVKLLYAYTVQQAEQCFRDHFHEISLIIMVARLDMSRPSNTLDTLELVSRFREKGFKGPIIAASGRSTHQSMLKAMGCNHEATKAEVPNKVLELLGLQ